jgi:nicotinic acid mononucleotide adenylyltransferase
MKKMFFNNNFKIIFLWKFFLGVVFAQGNMSAYPEYAIYSGSFDPPTLAHGEIIRQVLKQYNLKKIYIIVNKYNKKNFKSSANQRIKMMEIMLGDLKEKVVILSQDSPNKRTDYLILKKILNKPILLFTGEDSYLRKLDLPEKERLSFDYTVIIPRNSRKIDRKNLEKNATVLHIDPFLLNVSSTKARDCLKLKNCKKTYGNASLNPRKYQTMQDLCDANKVTAKYVQLILRLNFLAPKLKEAILLGYQPRHMKLADLMQNIPSLWHEQGELFGCEVF